MRLGIEQRDFSSDELSRQSEAAAKAAFHLHIPFSLPIPHG